MDAKHFDTLTRTLREAGTRRGLLGLLAALPLLGGLFALLDRDETDAKGRRKRRKKAHKHGKGRHKRKKKCKAHSKTKTCQGKCGPVKNNCRKTVDCPPCACSAELPCPSGQCCGADGACDACLVFVTSTGSTGDLGGLDGADGRCQLEAQTADRPGAYRAWLGDDSGAPATRFTRATVPYVLRDGTIVANNWVDLTTVKPSGNYLAAPINQTVSGVVVSESTPIWTNVQTDGTAGGSGGESCLNWQSDTEVVGAIASSAVTNAAWTEAPGSSSCSNSAPRFYCFQQS